MLQRRVPTVQTVQLTAETLQLPFLGLVLDSPLLCIDRCVAYVPVIMQRQGLSRCVGGGASIQFIDKVVLRCGQGKLRPEVTVTPRGSSQSNGAVERMNQIVAAMCRTFKVLVEDECHIKIVEGHVLNAWLVRDSAWVLLHPRQESGGTFSAETPQENGKRLASGHLGRTNEQLQRAHFAHPRRGTALQVGSTA